MDSYPFGARSGICRAAPDECQFRDLYLSFSVFFSVYNVNLVVLSRG